MEGYAYKIKEEQYIEEMNHFFRAIKGEMEYSYTLEEDKKVLDTLNMAEESSEKGSHVKIP